MWHACGTDVARDQARLWARTRMPRLPDHPVCLDPPRSGSGPATEAQARLRVYVSWSPFLGHLMPTATDGLEP